MNDKLPIRVCMLTLNEGEHLAELLPKLVTRVKEVLVVDSYSSDNTVDVCLENGVRVIQRAFTNFGDQWNFAVSVPSDQPWCMKLDPDERLSDSLWDSISRCLTENGEEVGFEMSRRLWFMGKPLHVVQKILRLWKSGSCRFTEVLVNEHPIVSGKVGFLQGYLEHLDSKDLHHWLDKQNHYSSMEAVTAHRGLSLADKPRFFGSAMQRRMWFKKNFFRIPFRYQLLGLGLLFGSGAWRDGKVGIAWVRMRLFTRRMREYKVCEMRTTGRLIEMPERKTGKHDSRAEQA